MAHARALYISYICFRLTFQQENKKKNKRSKAPQTRQHDKRTTQPACPSVPSPFPANRHVYAFYSMRKKKRRKKKNRRKGKKERRKERSNDNKTEQAILQ
jgi:hypothetical protein